MNNKKSIVLESRRTWSSTSFTHWLSVSLTVVVATGFFADEITMAQEVSDADEGVVIEEIIVTATKRGLESAQNVPISITAFSEQFLKDKRVDNFFDYALFVPGLSFQDAGPGDKTYIIRGANSTGTGVATVGMYIDEMLVSGDLRQPDFKLFDIQRVEVLRGPQGTLYGDGSLTGTIRIITNQPDPSGFSAVVDGAISTTSHGEENYEGNAMINVPLVEDRLALRAVAYIRDMGGFIDNVRLGNQNVNWEETEGYRISLLYAPSDTTRVTATAMHQDTELDGRFIFTTADGTLGDFNTDQYVIDGLDDEIDLYNLTLVQEFNSGTLTASTSFFDREVSDDFDSTPFNLQFGEFLFLNILGLPTINGVTNQTDTTEAWTTEIRYASNLGGRIEFVAGVFYQELETTFDTLVVSTMDDGTRFIPVLGIFGEFLANETEKLAVFGEVSYQFNDKWTGLVGLRWFTADQKDDRVNTFPFGGFAPPSIEPTVSTSEDTVTPKFQLSYQVSDDAMIFATAAQGFRVGGGNQNPIFPLPPENQQYDSDSLWNFEVGAKTRWMDDRLQVNGGVYVILWDDIQVSDFTDDANSFSFIGNAGEATSIGFELEVVARPTVRLDLQATLAYTNSELTEDQPTANFGFGGRDGDAFPNVPEWQASLASRYTWPINNNLDAFVSGDIAYVDGTGTQFNPTSPIYNVKDDYTLVDAKIGIRGDRWTAQIFIDNVFDELAEVNIIEQASNLTPRAIVPNWPRTIGLNMRYQF